MALSLRQQARSSRPQVAGSYAPPSRGGMRSMVAQEPVQGGQATVAPPTGVSSSTVPQLANPNGRVSTFGPQSTAGVQPMGAAPTGETTIDDGRFAGVSVSPQAGPAPQLDPNLSAVLKGNPGILENLRSAGVLPGQVGEATVGEVGAAPAGETPYGDDMIARRIAPPGGGTGTAEVQTTPGGAMQNMATPRSMPGRQALIQQLMARRQAMRQRNAGAAGGGQPPIYNDREPAPPAGGGGTSGRAAQPIGRRRAY